MVALSFEFLAPHSNRSVKHVYDRIIRCECSKTWSVCTCGFHWKNWRNNTKIIVNTYTEWTANFRAFQNRNIITSCKYITLSNAHNSCYATIYFHSIFRWQWNFINHTCEWFTCGFWQKLHACSIWKNCQRHHFNWMKSEHFMFWPFQIESLMKTFDRTICERLVFMVKCSGKWIMAYCS